MKKYKVKDFTRGWLIGDFEPCIMRTKDFEVGILLHKKGEDWPKHYHKIADEHNVLISGKMEINGTHFEAGDIFTIEKGEVSKPTFHEDCMILVIKVPSVIGDKYEV